jgi:hypothetical protein
MSAVRRMIREAGRAGTARELCSGRQTLERPRGVAHEMIAIRPIVVVHLPSADRAVALVLQLAGISVDPWRDTAEPGRVVTGKLWR